MSFVYAEKSTAEFGNQTNIFSDTKTTLIGAYRSNWSEKTRKAIEKYGFAKCVNVRSDFAVAFAGNNTAYAHDLLRLLYGNESFPVEYAMEKAYNIHKAANKDDVEFILCYADDNNETHIVCIKEQELKRDLLSAWIGSYDAFCILQELRTTSRTSFTDFKSAVDNCKDDSVGGLIICDSYFENDRRFLFPERLEAHIERSQIVPPGGKVIFSRPADTGDCTIHYIENINDVIIQFQQNKTTIMYTNRYRYSEEDIKNDNTNLFLLPIILDSATMQPL